MRSRRAKTEKSNKTKIAILIILMCMVTGIGVLLFIRTNGKNEEENSLTNNTIQDTIIDNNENTSEPKIKAYIVKKQKSEIVTNGATYNSNIKVYGERGNIESITHNGLVFEGTDLNKDGTYIVTIIPDNDTNSSYTVTFTIDTVVPTVQLNGKTIMGTSTTCKRGGIISLEGGKGTNKFTTALLVKYTSTGEATTETIDITAELKGSGYTVPTTLKAGDYYRVHLLDDKGNLIEFNGGDTLRIR